MSLRWILQVFELLGFLVFMLSLLVLAPLFKLWGMYDPEGAFYFIMRLDNLFKELEKKWKKKI